MARSIAYVLAFFLVRSSVVAVPNGSTNTAPPAVERIGPDRFRIGLVTVDAKLRQLRFPAEVNMTNGVIEYAIVHETGKVHESLFRTAARPMHVQLGALLLSSTNRPTGYRGCLVSLSWSCAGETNLVRVENMVRDIRAKRPMDDTPWRYVGSRTIEGVFLAEQSGSILGVIEDPEAVMDNPRPRRDDDENWEIIKEKVPVKPEGLEVLIDFNVPQSNP